MNEENQNIKNNDIFSYIFQIFTYTIANNNIGKDLKVWKPMVLNL